MPIKFVFIAIAISAVVFTGTSCRRSSPQATPFQPANYGLRGEIGTPGHSDNFIRPHEQRVVEQAEEEERTFPRQTATGPRRNEEREFPERLSAAGLSPNMGVNPVRAALGDRVETLAMANDDSGYMLTRPFDGHPGWYLQFRNGRLVDWREIPR